MRQPIVEGGERGAATTGDLAPLLPVVGADLEVPLVDGRRVRYANLDCAASGPALHAVAEAVTTALPYYASVHRGAGYPSQVSTGLYERARATVAEFVDAGPGDAVVFTRHTTDALNLLATAVPPGRRVLVLDVEHHANLLPWRRGPHRVVRAGESWEATAAAIDRHLADGSYALLAVTGASNVTGEVVPLAALTERAHLHGARVAVDAAQLAPHRSVSMRESGADYIAFSGHKLYAPFGSGVLVGARDWLDDAPPYLAGGGAVTSVTLEETFWADSPARHEAGTPNVLGAVAVAAACRAISGLPPGALARHEAGLRARLLDRLAALPAVRVLRIWPDHPDTIGVVTFVVDGHDPGRLAAALSAEHGVGVRDGKFCAHPLLRRLGHDVGAVRASIGVGTSSEDIDRLLEAVGDLAEQGPRWSYEVVDGAWAPVPDPREPDPWGALGSAPRPVAPPCAAHGADDG